MHTIQHVTLAASLVAVIGACSSEGTRTPDCEGAKCDTPGGTADEECQKECEGSSDADCFTTCRTGKAMELCEARRADAVLSSQKAFTADSIRWACSDVEGVNTNGRDDRGQEYCEYYAVVQPPPASEGGDTPPPRDLGRTGSGEPLELELTDDQIFALEDNPDAIAGQCVFTSWHQDVAGELPVCGTAAGAEDSCPEMTLAEGARLPPWMKDGNLGFRMTSEMLRMVVGINSNNAAVDLLERCMAEFQGGSCLNELPSPEPEDDYIRGCMKTYGLFCTEWRRSDPTICTGALRAAECGCGVDTDADGKPDITDIAGIARALVPRQPQDGEVTLRGFRLGTWSDKDALPSGCRYMTTGDDSHTVVACNLTASDVLSARTDVKGKCREKYGDNVVVHIPVPTDAIVCAPPEGGAHTDTCGETVPWTAADATSVEEPEDCCKTCVTSKPCGDSCIPMDSTCTAEPGCACAADTGD